ncbi:MAG: methyltransferase family protein [Gemmatimonadaceae bacterium]
MPDSARDTAGVILPPPLIYLAGLVLGYVLHRVHPLPIYHPRITFPVGLAFVLAGIFINAAGIREFRRAQTSFIPTQPSSALLQRGPFAWTRNPLYLAMTLVYIGVSLLLQSLWPLIWLVPVLVVMHYGVIRREERYLERIFGDAYREYGGRVRRWF